MKNPPKMGNSKKSENSYLSTSRMTKATILLFCIFLITFGCTGDQIDSNDTQDSVETMVADDTETIVDDSDYYEMEVLLEEMVIVRSESSGESDSDCLGGAISFKEPMTWLLQGTAFTLNSPSLAVSCNGDEFKFQGFVESQGRPHNREIRKNTVWTITLFDSNGNTVGLIKTSGLIACNSHHFLETGSMRLNTSIYNVANATFSVRFTSWERC